MGVCRKSVSGLNSTASVTYRSCFESTHWSVNWEGRFRMPDASLWLATRVAMPRSHDGRPSKIASRYDSCRKESDRYSLHSYLRNTSSFPQIYSLEMLFNPTGLTECLQEWEDLEKDYQQIQVVLFLFSSANKMDSSTTLYWQTSPFFL